MSSIRDQRGSLFTFIQVTAVQARPWRQKRGSVPLLQQTVFGPASQSSRVSCVRHDRQPLGHDASRHRDDTHFGPHQGFALPKRHRAPNMMCVVDIQLDKQLTAKPPGKAGAAGLGADNMWFQ